MKYILAMALSVILCTNTNAATYTETSDANSDPTLADATGLTGDFDIIRGNLTKGDTDTFSFFAGATGTLNVSPILPNIELNSGYAQFHVDIVEIIGGFIFTKAVCADCWFHPDRSASVAVNAAAMYIIRISDPSSPESSYDPLGDYEVSLRIAPPSAAGLAPVPLPAAGWLLFAGIGAAATMRARRKPAAQQ